MTSLEPSSTLRRAAEAELRRLDRARDRLSARQTELEAEARQLAAELESLGERERTLTAVIGERAKDRPVAPDQTDLGSAPLRGAAIRERAARRYYLVHGAGHALHYRRWFELLLDEDVEIAGKDPLATFLTNLNRSPIVVRGDESGTYAIDPQAPERLRQELAEKQAELHDLTAVAAREVTPSSELQDHRAALLSDVRRLEALIAEAERVLSPEDAEAEPVERAA